MRDVVGGFLERRALLDPTRLALICEDERLTWAELDALVARTATMIAGAGIKPGDRVAVLMKNGVGFCALYHAIARLGAILCPINWRLAPAEIDYIVQHSGATLLVHDADFSETAASLTHRPACILVPTGGFSALMAQPFHEGEADRGHPRGEEREGQPERQKSIPRKDAGLEQHRDGSTERLHELPRRQVAQPPWER